MYDSQHCKLCALTASLCHNCSHSSCLGHARGIARSVLYLELLPACLLACLPDNICQGSNSDNNRHRETLLHGTIMATSMPVATWHRHIVECI